MVEQALNVAQTTIVQDAWGRGQDLTIHGWIYSLQDGLLRDLGVSMASVIEFRVRSRLGARVGEA